MTLPAFRLAFFVLVIAAAQAVGASPGVPDSLLPPPWSWKNASLEGNPTAIRTGKVLMIGGALTTLAGVVVLSSEFVTAVMDQASADSKCIGTNDSAACAYEPGEFSSVPPFLILAGLGSLATGIVIASIARDDSGRDKRYYAFVAPGLVGGGIRRRF